MFWGRPKKIAFDTLQRALASTPVPAYPNFDSKFMAQTDASLTAIGLVLSQFDAKGVKHPVAFGFRVLNKHDCNY